MSLFLEQDRIRFTNRRQWDAAKTRKMYANILVPIDFSDALRFALQEADALAQQHGCLTLLHVHPLVEVALLDFRYMQPRKRIVRVSP